MPQRGSPSAVNTCDFVFFDNFIYPVQWLRLRLSDVDYGPSQRRLLRTNARFSASVRPFVLNPEAEELFRQYRAAITFDTYRSLRECLFDDSGQNPFDSYSIEIRDGDRLIAFGVFDAGVGSIAGIVNVYHPNYHKYSPGKYLMLLKIDFARSRGLTYYYPGYIVSYYPKFDYKLYPCPAATEIYDSRNGLWLPFSWETAEALSGALLNDLQANYPKGEFPFVVGGGNSIKDESDAIQ